jgi:transglutaminase-like putative cysteine protease
VNAKSAPIHGEVRTERRDQRAEPEHVQAEADCPVTPENVAELGADEHKRGHHERDIVIALCTPVTVVTTSD